MKHHTPTPHNHLGTTTLLVFFSSLYYPVVVESHSSSLPRVIFLGSCSPCLTCSPICPFPVANVRANSREEDPPRFEILRALTFAPRVLYCQVGSPTRSRVWFSNQSLSVFTSLSWHTAPTFGKEKFLSLIYLLLEWGGVRGFHLAPRWAWCLHFLCAPEPMSIYLGRSLAFLFDLVFFAPRLFLFAP